MFPVVTFSHISCGRTAFFVSINPERNSQPVVGKHRARGENLPMYIPTVVRESSGKIVAMAGHFMATMDRIHLLAWVGTKRQSTAATEGLPQRRLGDLFIWPYLRLR